MNAHADMFNVAERNELNTPRGIYRSLDLGEKKVSSFLFTKTSANKRLLLCLLPFAADVQTSPAQVHGAKVRKKMYMCKKSLLLLS